MNQLTSILNQKLSIPENVLAQELNGEMVLLKIDSETYYSLNPVGSRIWQLLTEQENVETAMQQFLRVYALDEMQQADVKSLINELLDEGLLQATDEQRVEKINKEPYHNLLPYESPKLIKHGTVHDVTLSNIISPDFDAGLGNPYVDLS